VVVPYGSSGSLREKSLRRGRAAPISCVPPRLAPTPWPRRPKQFVTIEAYARQKTSALLRQLAFLLGRVTQSSDPTLIADLCTALERFELCLFIFLRFYPRAEAKKIQRRVRKMSRLSRHVYDHDVGLAFLTHTPRQLRGQISAPRREESALHNRLSQQRKLTLQALREYIRKFKRREWSKRWRVRLGT
jgi:hypothetical protein